MTRQIKNLKLLDKDKGYGWMYFAIEDGHTFIEFTVDYDEEKRCFILLGNDSFIAQLTPKQS